MTSESPVWWFALRHSKELDMNEEEVDELFRELDAVQEQRVSSGPVVSDQTKWLVVDLETTGFRNSDTIIELGMVAYQGTKRLGQWGHLIRLHGQWSAEAEAVHKIKQSEFLKTAQESDEEYGKRVRPIKAAMQTFAKWAKAADVIVAYNASFDRRMLMHWSAKQGVNLGDDLVWVCPHKLAQQVGLGAELHNLKLETLAKHYGVPMGQMHRAVEDSDVTASVLLEMLARNKITLEQVASKSGPSLGRASIGKDVDEALYGGQRRRRTVSASSSRGW
jgi:DNA polymerase III epsilon subunit-like protein